MKMNRKTKVIASLIACALAGTVFLVARQTLRSNNSSHGQLTTDTRSSAFSGDRAKIAFLKKYLNMNSEVEATEFHIWYMDNSGGMIPGPSEWNMQIVLKVKPENVSPWIDGLTQGGQEDISWGYRLLPSEERWAIKSNPVIYSRGRTVVAVFQPEGIIFKRVQAH